MFRYFTVHYAIEVHDSIIQKSGGLLGVLNNGLIESTLEHIKNDIYYPNIEDKLSYLIFSFVKNHCFNDGNKRSSIALGAYFLAINNQDMLIDRWVIEMENIVVDVADNVIDRDLLHQIVTSLIYEEDYAEELKLKIIAAKMKMRG